MSLRNKQILAFSLLLILLVGITGLVSWLNGGLAKTAPFIMDGQVEDWAEIEPLFSDPTGDAGASGVDFGVVSARNDANYLYILFETGKEVNLQNDSNITLYLDYDASAETGLSYNGLGSDLVYRFGERNGKLYSGQAGRQVSHSDVGLVTLPTVTATRFEIALRHIPPPGTGLRLVEGQEIRIALADTSEGGDIVPNQGQFIVYVVQAPPEEPVEIISLEKENPDAIRIMTWNMLKDGLFRENRQEAFGRIIQAIQPDIINFQESYVYPSENARLMVEEWLPLKEGQWYSFKGNDMITISRYPIVMERAPGLIALSGATPFLLQISPDQRMLIVNAHLRCCQAEVERQRQADGFVKFIRELQSTPEGLAYLPEGSPFLLVGDLNLVGESRQLTTLLTGDILDEERYGPDHTLDWDDTALADLLSRHTNTNFATTWRDSQTTYSPGRLDFMIYTDSRLEVVKTFILDTNEMTAEQLEQYGLKRGDSATATDHLPIVADFVLIKR